MTLEGERNAVRWSEASDGYKGQKLRQTLNNACIAFLNEVHKGCPKNSGAQWAGRRGLHSGQVVEVCTVGRS